MPKQKWVDKDGNDVKDKDGKPAVFDEDENPAPDGAKKIDTEETEKKTYQAEPAGDYMGASITVGSPAQLKTLYTTTLKINKRDVKAMKLHRFGNWTKKHASG